MKNEIKVGDCFKDNLTGSIWIVTGFRNKRTVSTIRVSAYVGSPLMGTDFFKKYCEPITRAEFDAALDARFAAIKAEAEMIEECLHEIAEEWPIWDEPKECIHCGMPVGEEDVRKAKQERDRKENRCADCGYVISTSGECVCDVIPEVKR